jgi:hypothetical protein
LQILTTARKHFARGGPRRLQYTLPPLVFEALKLVRSLQAQDLPEEGEGSGSVSLKKVFQFLHQTVEALAMIPAAELSLRLYLQCAEAAGDCGLEPVAYEFFTQAFVLYEEEISVSHEADATHCDVQLAYSKETPCLLLCCCVGIAGFQGPSDCPSTHYWHVAKNTGVWS